MYFLEVSWINSGTRHDDDLISIRFDQLSKEVGPFGNGCFLTTGKNSFNPQFNEIFDRLKGVNGHIKRPVKGNWQRADNGNQLFASLLIDLPFGSKNAEDNGVCPRFFEETGILLHRLKLQVGV